MWHCWFKIFFILFVFVMILRELARFHAYGAKPRSICRIMNGRPVSLYSIAGLPTVSPAAATGNRGQGRTGKYQHYRSWWAWWFNSV